MSLSIIEQVSCCEEGSENWMIDNQTIRLTLWKIRLGGKQSENNDNLL